MASRLVLLGAPGCGKGTQAERISERLNIPAISTGEMLRAAVAAQSELGQRVAGILNSGELVDDETMALVVKQRLAQSDAQEGFLLDGYPRTLVQTETLAGILRDAGSQLDAVIQIEVPEDELVRRALERKREDDTEEIIKHRLQVYQENTAPLVGHYREQGLLLTVNGDRSIGTVTDSIMLRLEEAA